MEATSIGGGGAASAAFLLRQIACLLAELVSSCGLTAEEIHCTTSVREITTKRTRLDSMVKVPTAATQAPDQTAPPSTRLHGLVPTRRSPLSEPRMAVGTRAHVEALDARAVFYDATGVRTIGT
ncbi:hypothetical protein M514_11730 [Trichuris suis]|uniref:Uncharacterized protein n=1 Tax=Trichuris suis TaxID=68888 RepID=A0A085MW02_9BILA|nr:hypothetical protein M513_11730 [Trichuris suis]KFD61398.1 hypothetical protein M514_11730 [Trichuris suis]